MFASSVYGLVVTEFNWDLDTDTRTDCVAPHLTRLLQRQTPGARLAGLVKTLEYVDPEMRENEFSVS